MTFIILNINYYTLLLILNITKIENINAMLKDLNYSSVNNLI
jgi:hypothetical protein